jgi:hypothetical protein
MISYGSAVMLCRREAGRQSTDGAKRKRENLYRHVFAKPDVARNSDALQHPFSARIWIFVDA